MSCVKLSVPNPSVLMASSSLALKRVPSSTLISKSLFLIPSDQTLSFKTNLQINCSGRPMFRCPAGCSHSEGWDEYEYQFKVNSGGNLVVINTWKGWEMRLGKEAIYLKLEMPGFGKEDVQICLENNNLTIKGDAAKDSEHEENNEFAFTTSLPSIRYRVDQIKAEMKNGVLKMVIPKLKEQSAKHIINVD